MKNTSETVSLGISRIMLLQIEELSDCAYCSVVAGAGNEAGVVSDRRPQFDIAIP